MFLAGDIGGTKTLLGLFELSGGRRVSVREASFPSQGYPSLESIIDDFLSAGASRRKLRGCAVGVAGPVVRGRSQVVNLRWPVDSRRLAGKLGLARVQVLNDLEATAWGVTELPARKTENLTPGVRPALGNAAVIAAGTGLGMALLVLGDGHLHATASEGGHQEFGPRDDLEIELLRYLRQRHGRVSIERVVSGPGLSAIYQFLVDTGRGSESESMSRRLAEAPDRNAVITEAGLAGEDPTAERALDRFVSLYGAAAGDLALVAQATGGVFVGGGIAPKILPKLRTGEFVRAFRAKGRLASLVEKIPVRVILEPRTALLGAAVCAARSAGDHKAVLLRARNRREG